MLFILFLTDRVYAFVNGQRQTKQSKLNIVRVSLFEATSFIFLNLKQKDKEILDLFVDGLERLPFERL